MKFVGVGFDAVGKRRTIYSLRHTYATMRLAEGVNIYALAKNMGASVSIIERFYGQMKTPDQEAELNKMRAYTKSAGSILEALDR